MATNNITETECLTARTKNVYTVWAIKTAWQAYCNDWTHFNGEKEVTSGIYGQLECIAHAGIQVEEVTQVIAPYYRAQIV